MHVTCKLTKELKSGQQTEKRQTAGQEKACYKSGFVFESPPIFERKNVIELTYSRSRDRGLAIGVGFFEIQISIVFGDNSLAFSLS